jgi:DNA-binding NtrC family response regulator
LPSPRNPNQPILRAVICACATPGADALAQVLENEGCVTVHCASHESLLEELVRNPVDAIVVGFSPPCSLEPALLRLIRRLHPETPLVIVARDATLEMERMFREYRPLFVAVPPWDRGELRDVVRAVRAHRSRKGVSAPSPAGD